MSRFDLQHQPAISVVMPLYNKERDVARAIRSVLAQTFADYELIVVNDGSTDGGPAVARSFQDPRIRHLDQENAGVSCARNRGVREAKAELIAFLDSDDEWKPAFLETILDLNRIFPDCKVFATAYYVHSQNSGRRPVCLRNVPACPWRGVLDNYFQVAVGSEPPVWSSAVAVTRAAFHEAGGFPEGVASGEDLLTWARMACRYSIAYCNEPLAVFYTPDSLADRPTRIPQSPDRVSEGLADLIASSSPDLQFWRERYLAHWHTMRAVIYIQLGEAIRARLEVEKAENAAGKSAKTGTLKIISLLPGTLPRHAYLFLRGVKRFLGHYR
jgi:glycosyltransferase involved in cell wall biosynthesis